MNILKIDEDYISVDEISEAAEIIKSGGIVIFPTETVYGVAADAYNEDAVRRVYEVKKRPLSQPLPVMVASGELVGTVAREVSGKAQRLIARFFPGPLTLVLKKNPELPSIVTSGGDTVGVRIPNHPVAIEWLKAVGKPIAATSANLHGGPEPKTADEAVLQIGESVDLVIDSGEVQIGMVSTIIDMTVTPPKILRAGALSKEILQQEIGEVTD